MNIYLDNFENWNASDGVTTVTGIEFGIKHSLFQDYLLMDTVYPAIAMVIVLLVMCVYTRSMFITLMTMFAIISSLIVSYFLYRVVFNFEFFPFMNLTALIILVGIGADDAFVLCDVWSEHRAAARRPVHVRHQFYHGSCLLRQLREQHHGHQMLRGVCGDSHPRQLRADGHVASGGGCPARAVSA